MYNLIFLLTVSYQDSAQDLTQTASPEEFLTGKPPRRRRRERTQFSAEGLRRLEAIFVTDRYPDIHVRDTLADELGVTEDRIQTWFQNRRSRQKRRHGNFQDVTSFNINPQMIFPSAYGSPMGLRHINVCPPVVTSPIVQPPLCKNVASMWAPAPLQNSKIMNASTPKPLVQVKPMKQHVEVKDGPRLKKKSEDEQFVDVEGLVEGIRP